MRKIIIASATLISLVGFQRARAEGDLERLLHLCEKPRLEYWNRLCAEVPTTEPQAATQRRRPAGERGTDSEQATTTANTTEQSPSN